MSLLQALGSWLGVVFVPGRISGCQELCLQGRLEFRRREPCSAEDVLDSRF